MYLFVGLGNPGPTYAMNRHNIGFMAIDVIADNYDANPWQNRFQGQVTTLQGLGETILLCKPLTFMNLSAKCVAAVMQFYKIPLNHIYVFHDDLDLAPGKVKIKCGGGAAGHNGLLSLDRQIGPDYWRVRLGIGHPGFKSAVTSYVLGNFTSQETEDWVIPLLRAIAAEAPTLITVEPGAWLTKLNQRLRESSKGI